LFVSDARRQLVKVILIENALLLNQILVQYRNRNRNVLKAFFAAASRDDDLLERDGRGGALSMGFRGSETECSHTEGGRNE
jgi:hypothetical protein